MERSRLRPGQRYSRLLETMTGQMSIFDCLNSLPDIVWGGCGPCICKKCLYYQSGRCRYGCCYDDKRASDEPYDKKHPDDPPRTAWSNWNKPGEQGHWCRGGVFYPTYQCDYFKRYTGIKIEECIRCNTIVYQDGYRFCQLVENVGCKACYESMMQNLEDMETENGEIDSKKQ